jgi:hypothetical protein
MTNPVSEPPPVVVAEDPLVRTDNATDVYQTSARLRGYVDPRGSGHWWFEFGKSSSSLIRVSGEYYLSNSSDVHWDQTSLEAATEYFYRLVFKRDGKIFNGPTRSLMTDF